MGHVGHVVLAHILETGFEDRLRVEGALFDQFEKLGGYFARCHGLTISCSGLTLQISGE